MYEFINAFRVNWMFKRRDLLPIVDVVGILPSNNPKIILNSAVKIIGFAEECNGILYPSGIKRPRPQEDCTICYFAILFTDTKDITKFREKTQTI